MARKSEAAEVVDFAVVMVTVFFSISGWFVGSVSKIDCIQDQWSRGILFAQYFSGKCWPVSRGLLEEAEGEGWEGRWRRRMVENRWEGMNKKVDRGEKGTGGRR